MILDFLLDSVVIAFAYWMGVQWGEHRTLSAINAMAAEYNAKKTTPLPGQSSPAVPPALQREPSSPPTTIPQSGENGTDNAGGSAAPAPPALSKEQLDYLKYENARRDKALDELGGNSDVARGVPPTKENPYFDPAFKRRWDDAVSGQVFSVDSKKLKELLKRDPDALTRGNIVAIPSPNLFCGMCNRAFELGEKAIYARVMGDRGLSLFVHCACPQGDKHDA